VPLNLWLYAGLGIAALGWMTMFKITSDLACKLQTHLEIERGMTSFIQAAISKTLKKHGVRPGDEEGTLPADTCLNKEDGGSDEVQ
jgi:hypothetical protein